MSDIDNSDIADDIIDIELIDDEKFSTVATRADVSYILSIVLALNRGHTNALEALASGDVERARRQIERCDRAIIRAADGYRRRIYKDEANHG